MPGVPESFRAFVVEKLDDRVEANIRSVKRELLAGDVAIKVAWSSVNFKDALATMHGGGVARISPLVPGIDMAGIVVESPSGAVPPGTEVLVHGYDVGVSRHGGFAEYAQVERDWVVPLPRGLSLEDAMAIGTAGFTAALSIDLLEQHGLRRGSGPVLVTGATGGVGSAAVQMLSQLGYEVVASTGKAAAHEWLERLGASRVIDRSEASAEGRKPLERQLWAGAVDPVGGSTLAYVLRSLRYGAAVAASGNTGGTAVETSVFPFILRGVQLLGVDSVQLPVAERAKVWSRLAGDLRPRHLSTTTETIGMEELPAALERIRSGEMRGRTTVRVSS